MGAFLALLGLSVCLPVQSDNFPDSPKNHWAYEARSDLKSTGVLVGYPDGLGPHGILHSRYEFATATNAAFTRLHNLASGLESQRDKLALSLFGTAELSKQLDGWNLDVKSLTGSRYGLGKQLIRQENELVRLIVEFTPELKALGVEVDGLTGQVKRDAQAIRSMRPVQAGEALQQFPDVPADHWAADAVKNLRSLGILHGYPDGKYRG